MDVYINHVPEQLSERQLESFLRQYVTSVGCKAFQVKKMKNRPYAFLTIPDAKAAQRFLDRFTGQNALKWRNHPLEISRGRKDPDPLVLNALRRKEEQISREPRPQDLESQNLVNYFCFGNLNCGIWEAKQAETVFSNYYQDPRQGRLILGRNSLKMILLADAKVAEQHQLEVHYRCIDNITVGDENSPHITFTLQEAPKLSHLPSDNVAEIMEDLSLRHRGKQKFKPRTRDNVYFRTPYLQPAHNAAAGCCLIYRIVLPDAPQLKEFERTLRGTPGSPPFTRWIYSKYNDDITFQEQLNRFSKDLGQEHRAIASNTAAYKMPFILQFQLQRLVYNSILSPHKTRRLCGEIQLMLTKYTPIAIVEAIRKVARGIKVPGPHVDPVNFSTRRIIKAINAAAASFKTAGTAYEIVNRHSHLGMIHRVNITPTGMHLEGPEIETKNRILRQYPQYMDHFIRVSFLDENYQKLMGSRNLQPEEIYHGRFKDVLQQGIYIGGRTFVFLGFSNSSLHTHQCWFMSAFYDGQLNNAERIIQGLGDFSVFRSPARCAARIGQTFSDATDTITIDRSCLFELEEIERHDSKGIKRTFSDGVGTISQALLQDVWKEFQKAKRERATCLQIRFQGAKGMLSLDNTLEGKRLGLRPSMVKFTKSPSYELEICGAAYKALPMYLNRQYIKILEDLGVPSKAFMDLQDKAVNNIRTVMTHPTNAANFLDVNFVSTAARIPNLIRSLMRLGHNFRDDEFLRDVVEMVAFYRLREIKYRGRIPVANAYTLYGVVDETGFLAAGQVYAVARDEHGHRHVLAGDLLVTRAPALHPGDVQIARAVDVPDGSILSSLHNCVVFSQHGDRDLPSMLSGGDLDGDVYSVILEQSIWPAGTYTAADYARPRQIDIGRPVQKRDIIDFFIDYMESDQLGRIANAHMQVADQKRLGTNSDECLLLAELHSTAVDFAKNGIAVDIHRFPRSYHMNLKPDFMAKAPRLLLDKHSKLTLEEAITYQEAEDDPIAAMDEEVKGSMYYKSEKILGQLYRAIDEKRIHQEIRQTQSTHYSATQKPGALMEGVYKHVLQETLNVDWQQFKVEAREIKARYEENMVETAHQFTASAHQPLAELEVFTGMVLGKDGGLLDRRMRDRSIGMKEKFDQDVAFTVNWILHGDPSNVKFKARVEIQDDGFDETVDEEEGDDDDDDNNDDDDNTGSNALERGLACFAVAMDEETETYPKFGTPRSFRYIAAGICLKELQKRNQERIDGLLHSDMDPTNVWLQK